MQNDMKGITSIKRLIAVVRLLEKHQLTIGLIALASKLGETEGVKMVKRIRRNGDMKEERLINNLLNGKSKKNVDELAEQMTARLLDSVITPESYEFAGYNDFWKAEMKCRQIFMKLFSVYSIRSEVELLFKQGIALASKYECYSVLSEMYQWKRTRAIGSEGLAAAEEYEVLRLGAEAAQAAERNAFYQYDMWHASNSVNKGLPAKATEHLASVVTNLKQDYERTGASKILYHAGLLEMELHTANKDAHKLRETALDLIHSLETIPCLSSRQMLLATYSDLADGLMLCEEYTMALLSVDAAMRNERLNSVKNLVHLGFTKTICLLMTNDMGGFHSQLNDIKPLLLDAGAILLNKHRYFKAYGYFMQGKHKKSLKQIGQIEDLKHDREGWNMGMRLLEIQNCIELGVAGDPTFYDVAASTIPRWRKYHNLHSDGWNPRWDFMIKYLSRLEAAGFRFEDATIDLSQLAPWEPKTPELIPFETWLEKHLHATQQTA